MTTEGKEVILMDAEPHVMIDYQDDLYNGDQKFGTNCSCGARWTYKKGITEEEKKALKESHIKYTKRMATRVD